MSTRSQVQKKPGSNSYSPPAQKATSWQRPFSDSVHDTTISRKPDEAINPSAGFNLMQMKIFPDSPAPVQTKPTVSTPGDHHEREADIMASKVMKMSVPENEEPIQQQTAPEQKEEELQTKPLASAITPLVQRDEALEKESEEVQAKSLESNSIQRDEAPEQNKEDELPVQAKTAPEGSSQTSGNLESQLNGSKGGGSPLPNEVRSFMEPRFGADFSGVRVHTDGAAVQMNKELGAQAFAHGSDIYYSTGKSPGKDELTAHELTHVVQQTGAVQRDLEVRKKDTPQEEESEHISLKGKNNGAKEPKKKETEPKKPSESVSADDEAEFNLLKGKISIKNADQYVKSRNEFFGSAEAYQNFAAESDKELDETKVLRKLIEFENKPEAQTVFYRWVRKAYHNQGITNAPDIIKRGKTKELADVLTRIRANKDVKATYPEGFKAGGFNPRPKKDAKYRYRLGTLSEHGLGNAVDIEDKLNPIISIEDWQFIEKLTGKTVDRKLTRWQKEPEALWKDIKELNDLFVATIATELKNVEKEMAEAKSKEEAEEKSNSKRAKSKSGSNKNQKTKTPIDVLFAQKKFSTHGDLKPWVGGFFTLKWELVNQFYANKLIWGATFPNAVDLHHFELIETDPKDWESAKPTESDAATNSNAQDANNLPDESIEQKLISIDRQLDLMPVGSLEWMESIEQRQKLLDRQLINL